MNVRPESLAVIWVDSLAMACVGSLAIARVGSCFAGCIDFFVVTEARFFVIAFTGFSELLGADFCVIT